jgi:hypothetical protein
MKRTFLFGLLNLIFFVINAGQPVPGAEVYIEQTNEAPIAYQQTGNNGKVTFSHLSSGRYHISVTLPEQSGKLTRGRKKTDCKLKAGYHQENKEYFLQESEGFFIVQFSKLKRLDDHGISPVYNPRSEDGKKRILIGRFAVDSKRGGSITLSLEAEKPKQFLKKVEKVRHDASMAAIRNMK